MQTISTLMIYWNGLTESGDNANDSNSNDLLEWALLLMDDNSSIAFKWILLLSGGNAIL
jgi:hypothetical protein